MPTHKLMIKTHNKTGMKYLCYTKKEGKDYDSYLGSGKIWLEHLNEFGEDIKTELIFECEDYHQFKKTAINKSLEFDVVQSDEWANLKHEEGDGGDTTSKKTWITDGSKDRYIDNGEHIPSGWKRGRSTSVFNDPAKQKEFSRRVDRKKAGQSIKLAWDEGRVQRDHSKCGRKGEKNPSKRPEVRESIRLARIEQSKQIKKCPNCGKEFKGSAGLSLHSRRSRDCISQ